MMLFTILAVTIPAAILNGNGVKVSFPTCVLNAMQCFAGVGAFFLHRIAPVSPSVREE